MRLSAEQFVYACSYVTSAQYRYDRIYEQLEELDEEDPYGIR